VEAAVVVDQGLGLVADPNGFDFNEHDGMGAAREAVLDPSYEGDGGELGSETNFETFRFLDR
jgi:hypothetical protein